jgi:hypothetical protein
MGRRERVRAYEAYEVKNKRQKMRCLLLRRKKKIIFLLFMSDYMGKKKKKRCYYYSCCPSLRVGFRV